MTQSDLLKEAIADAKAVKETAIANAKLALEEAFTPRIQSIISSRLEEEGDEEEMMEPEMEPEMGAADDGLDVGDLSIDIDNDGEFDEFDIMSKPSMEEVPTEEVPTEEVPTEEPVDEYDLSEILRQLDEEDMEDEVKEYGDEHAMSAEDALDTDDEELDIDALLEELMGSDEEGIEPEVSADDEMMKENEALKLELEEAYNAIRTMKESLNEVNMLNAKLLFTNKLFKAHSLNESQKVKVIDTFDRARTIREVKLVYATLAESLSNKKSLVKESIASKPVASTKPKQIILTESEQIANRFKKLAGLGK
jgi:hypothetical protein